MPIEIKSAHAAAAEQMPPADEKSAVKTQTNVDTGDAVSEMVEQSSTPVSSDATERVTVGMSFKMPIAQYTMLEFSVARTMAFTPDQSADAVFDEAKDWVEGKINALIEENQNG